MGDFSKIGRAAGALAWSSALLLSGCGVLPSVVQTTTEAALTPFANMAQQATYGLGVASSAATTTSANLAQTVGVYQAAGVNTAQNFNAMSSASTQSMQALSTPAYSGSASPASYSPSPGMTDSQKATVDKAMKSPQPELKVLPKEVLAKLTTDQRGLQRAAQRSALSAPVGETLFWDNNGRSGSAITDHERAFGDMMCRSFTEALVVDGKKTEASATACKDSHGGKWALAF
jgi:surface antigen